MSTKAERRKRIKEKNASAQLKAIDTQKINTGGQKIGRHDLRRKIHAFNVKESKARQILSTTGASA